MTSKQQRFLKIKEILSNHKVCGQDELNEFLNKIGVIITQATLSRDLKDLKVIKVPDEKGIYYYTLSNEIISETSRIKIQNPERVSLAFSNQLAVVRTRPGYATGIASEIDFYLKNILLGSVAGDDTILLIPKDDVKKEDIICSLKELIQEVDLL